MTRDQFVRHVHDWSFATSQEAIQAIGQLPPLEDLRDRPIAVYLDPPQRWGVMLESTAQFLGLMKP